MPSLALFSPKIESPSLPQQFLRETQSTVGDINPMKWHDTFIVSGKELNAV
jgi:hypothetical protein